MSSDAVACLLGRSSGWLMPLYKYVVISSSACCSTHTFMSALPEHAARFPSLHINFCHPASRRNSTPAAAPLNGKWLQTIAAALWNLVIVLELPMSSNNNVEAILYWLSDWLATRMLRCQSHSYEEVQYDPVASPAVCPARPSELRNLLLHSTSPAISISSSCVPPCTAPVQCVLLCLCAAPRSYIRQWLCMSLG
jgi:hypothetical protein